MQPRPRICQYGVHDASYPRNARLRAYLSVTFDADVVVVEQDRTGGRLRRALSDVTRFWRGSRGAAVVVLSEFRLTHAPLAWLVARLRGATLVVDHFVGLHETVVGDWGADPASPRARILAFQDRIAARLADVCVTDTTCRAETLARRHGAGVLALPVGAPAWAAEQPTRRTPGRPLSLLYYGNYLPLHGVDRIVDALAAVDRDVVATFIGGGSGRSVIESRVVQLGIAERIRFVDPVPESDLLAFIAEADVVLGAFGPSEKARSVAPNKVWQGLACGRVVLTQDGPAVRELRAEIGDRLVLVDPADIGAMVEAIRSIDPAAARAVDAPDVVLESFVARGFATLGRVLAPALGPAVDAGAHR